MEVISLPQEPLVLRPGMVVAPVGNVQEQLNTVGYYGLAVDNIFGQLTEEALRDFQVEAGIPVTGVVDPQTWARLFTGDPLPGEVIAPPAVPADDRLQLAQAPNRIEINLGQRTLRLLRGGSVVATYPVAIGKPATPTPIGTFSILNKALNPGGPFGTRWMGVTPDGIGIHGTNAPSSIGLAVSNGCIRMYNEDVEVLYNQVNVGEPVVIVGGAAAPGAGFNYTVQPGETLFTLARRFGTTVAAIKAANNLTGDTIFVGQTLFIPGPVTGGGTSTYSVRPGDTLYSIARRFGTTVAALQAANNLTSTVIFPGQVLRIPTTPTEPPPPQPGPPAPGPGTTTYVVQPGDTLFLIARRFNTTVARLRELNNLASDFILAGQILVVPAGEQFYTVQPGDTLFLIAQRFNTTVTELVRLNALTSTEIFPGQVLRVR